MFGNTKLFYFGSSKLRIEEQSLEAFDSLDLDLDIGDVTIISGTKYSISVECSEDIFPEIENEAGQLSVSQSREGIIFGFGNSYECSVSIEVPGDAYLDRVDLFLHTMSDNSSRVMRRDFRKFRIRWPISRLISPMTAPPVSLKSTFPFFCFLFLDACSSIADSRWKVYC